MRWWFAFGFIFFMKNPLSVEDIGFDHDQHDKVLLQECTNVSDHSCNNHNYNNNKNIINIIIINNNNNNNNSAFHIESYNCSLSNQGFETLLDKWKQQPDLFILTTVLLHSHFTAFVIEFSTHFLKQILSINTIHWSIVYLAKILVFLRMRAFNN